MRIIKPIIIFLGVIILLVLIGFWFIGYSEEPKSYFKNYDEAERSGIMSRGWIPTFIPKSSANIYEQHSIDSSWVEMKFEYDPRDIESTREACDSEKPIENGVLFLCTYFERVTEIKLYENGQGTLYTSSH